MSITCSKLAHFVYEHDMLLMVSCYKWTNKLYGLFFFLLEKFLVENDSLNFEVE